VEPHDEASRFFVRMLREARQLPLDAYPARDPQPYPPELPPPMAVRRTPATHKGYVLGVAVSDLNCSSAISCGLHLLFSSEKVRLRGSAAGHSTSEWPNGSA